MATIQVDQDPKYFHFFGLHGIIVPVGQNLQDYPSFGLHESIADGSDDRVCQTALELSPLLKKKKKLRPLGHAAAP